MAKRGDEEDATTFDPVKISIGAIGDDSPEEVLEFF